jgi:glycosyltransferase involved in cell wall biosynthesis
MTVDVSAICDYAARLQPEQKRDALSRYGIEHDHARLLFLGRLEPHKGLLDLLVAFRQLKQKIDAVSLLIVGDGSLSDIVIDESRLGHSVHYLGRLVGEHIWEAYALADIFVLPSHFEPWGLVINEAMASGLPVIVSDRVGCIDDLVLPQATGLVVAARSPDDLLAAMEALAMDPPARLRMGAAGRRHIARWTLQNAATITVSAWRRVCA